MVWVDSNFDLKALNLECKPYPGYFSEWVDPLVIALTRSKDKSIIICDGISSLARELNSMGAKINIISSNKIEIGNAPVLKPFKGDISDKLGVINACLKSKSKSRIIAEQPFELKYIQNLKILGAKISELS